MDGWVIVQMASWMAGNGSSTRQLPWILARDKKWVDFPQIWGTRAWEGELFFFEPRDGTTSRSRV